MNDPSHIHRAAFEPGSEAAVRADRERLRLILESIPHGVEECTADGTIVYTNQACGKILGCSPGDLVGRKIWEVEEGDRREELRALLEELVARQPVPTPWHSRIRALDGRLVDVELVWNYLHDASGHVAGFVSILTDVTERVRTTTALEETLTRLRTIADVVPGVLYQYRLDVRGGDELTFVSARAEEILGTSPTALMGGASAAWDAVLPEDRARVAESVGRAAERFERWTCEFRMRRGDGTTIWVQAHAVPSPPEPDGSMLWNGIILDITEAKRLEEQFLQAQKMEGLGRLAGGVAHDFNNLLSAILGYLELAQDKLPEGHPVRRYIDGSRQSAERGAALTKRLLAFARRHVIEAKVVRMDEALAGIGHVLRPLLGEIVELGESYDDGLWPVRVDPGLLQQVVLNLAVNARDAMPEGGSIRLRGANVTLRAGDDRPVADMGDGDWVELSVSDTGHGMSEEIRRHLFEPFFTTKETGKGTGLGLATCYGIVRQSGGHIAVESEVGRGTRFLVYLPRAAGAVSRPDEPPEATPSGREAILLVEDEDMVREIAAAALRQRGYEVAEASDGENALLAAERRGRPFDLLLTDVVMPRMGGPALARELRRRWPGTRVLYMSGYTGDARLGGTAGDEFDLLAKPFAPSELAHKVREVLDRRR